MDIHIPRTSKCCNVLDVREFTRFQVAKHKAYLTPLLCLVIAPPKDIIPRRGLDYAAKVLHFFELSKKIARNWRNCLEEVVWAVRLRGSEVRKK